MSCLPTIADYEAAKSANREAVRLNLEYDGLHEFQGGNIYVDGTITCPAREQAGSVFAKHPTRLIQGNGPLFRLRGSDMQFGGQLCIIGNGRDPIFEVEGSHLISTGWHEWRGIKIYNCPPAGAWVALKGRYEFDEKTGVTGKWIDDPNHADNCLIDRCHTFGKNYTRFRSDNLQALNWTDRDGSVNIISDEDKGDIIGADLRAGGLHNFERLVINAPRFTKWRVWDISPNTSRLTSHDFMRDVPTTPNEYLTILDDTNMPAWIDGWKSGRWILHVDGQVPRHTRPYDTSKHFTSRALYSKERSRIAIDVVGEPPKR